MDGWYNNEPRWYLLFFFSFIYIIPSEWKEGQTSVKNWRSLSVFRTESVWERKVRQQSDYLTIQYVKYSTVQPTFRLWMLPIVCNLQSGMTWPRFPLLFFFLVSHFSLHDWHLTVPVAAFCLFIMPYMIEQPNNLQHIKFFTLWIEVTRFRIQYGGFILETKNNKTSPFYNCEANRTG